MCCKFVVWGSVLEVFIVLQPLNFDLVLLEDSSVLWKFPNKESRILAALQGQRLNNSEKDHTALILISIHFRSLEIVGMHLLLFVKLLM